VFSGYRRMLEVRSEQAAFHPAAPQQALAVKAGVFALLRAGQEGSGPVLCLVEVSGREHRVEIGLAEHGLPGGEWEDLLGGGSVSGAGGRLEVRLPAYGVAWLKPVKL
jgi:hypothetical protein